MYVFGGHRWWHADLLLPVPEAEPEPPRPERGGSCLSSAKPVFRVQPSW